MTGIEGFAIDMDGTVYKGSKPIDGAKDFITWLNERSIPFVFLTNNSSHGRDYYYDKVTKMGFPVKMCNVLTSTIATLRYIARNHPGETVYPVGTKQFVRDVEDADIMIDDNDPDIVLLSFDTSITYEKINLAYRFLNGRSKFIATHPDDLCPTEDGYDIDIGPFIRMFESMTGKTATVIGKPNRLMLEMAALEMGISVDGLVMVGDRLYTDIRMAADNGIRSIVVFTGETAPGDIAGSSVKPTFTAKSVADIPGMVESGSVF